MEITLKRQGSSFSREWIGLLFAMVWFFGTMYSYYDPLFSNDITQLVFMLLLGAQNIEKLTKTPYMLKGELYQLYKQKFL